MGCGTTEVMRMDKRMAMGVLASVAGLLSGCGRAGVIETRHLAWPAMEGQVLSVSSFNGDVVIRVAEGDSIRATATINSSLGAADAARIETAFVPGPATSLTASRPDMLDDAGVSFEIVVPPCVSLGSIETSNGRIEVAGGAGSPVFETSNGDVTVSGFAGRVRIDTSNGDVTAGGRDLVILGIDTSNGDIQVSPASFAEGAVLDTSNGDITAGLAPGAFAEFSMDTSNGSVSVEGPGFSEVRIDDSEGSAVMGGGGPRVELSSSNGNITVTSPGE